MISQDHAIKDHVTLTVGARQGKVIILPSLVAIFKAILMAVIFMVRSPLRRVTILPSLVAIDTMVVEM